MAGDTRNAECYAGSKIGIGFAPEQHQKKVMVDMICMGKCPHGTEIHVI
jgi:hypothetical protein